MVFSEEVMKDYLPKDIWKRLAATLEAVSYTHLDVYKRQALTGAQVKQLRSMAHHLNPAIIIGKSDVNAVSYTHLDVYKRQE